jgi:hypothetical protein
MKPESAKDVRNGICEEGRGAGVKQQNVEGNGDTVQPPKWRSRGGGRQKSQVNGANKMEDKTLVK